jgi:two-component system, response regulator
MDSRYDVFRMSNFAIPELVLIEDNLDDEAMSLRGIKKSGVACNVTVRRDGAEALDLLLGEESPPPALIVLDYKLPTRNGLEILTELRRHPRTRLTPVVIVSGTNSGAALTDCYHSGANSCVTKPDDPAEYVDRVSAIASYWLDVNHPSEGSGATSVTSRPPLFA